MSQETTVNDYSQTKTAFFKKSLKSVRNLSLNAQSLKKILTAKNIGIAVAALVIVVVGFKLVGGNKQSDLNSGILTQSSFAALNKKLLFPIKNQKGESTGSDLVVNATTVERTDKLLYNGRPLIARQSKDFIVVNMEIENSTKDRLTVRAVDFIRLVDENGKNYSADVQTEAVKVEPLSVKKTRTIFIIDESRKNLVFLLGDINSNREKVEITI